MGFSLKTFIEKLLAVLEDDSLDHASKLQFIRDIIEEDSRYARECGLLSD